MQDLSTDHKIVLKKSKKKDTKGIEIKSKTKPKRVTNLSTVDWKYLMDKSLIGNFVTSKQIKKYYNEWMNEETDEDMDRRVEKSIYTLMTERKKLRCEINPDDYHNITLLTEQDFSKYVKENYPTYNIMKLMECFMKKVFGDEINLFASFLYKSYIGDIKYIGGGASGQFYSLDNNGRSDMGIKYVRGEVNRHEYYVGKMGTNKLRQYTYGFAYIFSRFTCSRPTLRGKKVENWCDSSSGYVYIVQENISNSMPISSYMLEKNFLFKVWLIAYIQALLSIHIANTRIKFAHNDLHTSNILMKILDGAKSIPYKLDDDTTIYCNGNILPVIIDYDRAQFEHNGNLYVSSINPESYLENGFKDNVFADAYRLLCMSISDYYQRSIYHDKHIEMFRKIFRFFSKENMVSSIIAQRKNYYIIPRTAKPKGLTILILIDYLIDTFDINFLTHEPRFPVYGETTDTMKDLVKKYATKIKFPLPYRDNSILTNLIYKSNLFNSKAKKQLESIDVVKLAKQSHQGIKKRVSLAELLKQSIDEFTPPSTTKIKKPDEQIYKVYEIQSINIVKYLDYSKAVYVDLKILSLLHDRAKRNVHIDKANKINELMTDLKGTKYPTELDIKVQVSSTITNAMKVFPESMDEGFPEKWLNLKGLFMDLYYIHGSGMEEQDW